MNTIKYMLYADDTPIMPYDSLEQAQRNAADFIRRGCKAKIESLAAPAPTHTWTYDTDNGGWVHSF